MSAVMRGAKKRGRLETSPIAQSYANPLFFHWPFSRTGLRSIVLQAVNECPIDTIAIEDKIRL